MQGHARMQEDIGRGDRRVGAAKGRAQITHLHSYPHSYLIWRRRHEISQNAEGTAALLFPFAISDNAALRRGLVGPGHVGRGVGIRLLFAAHHAEVLLPVAKVHGRRLGRVHPEACLSAGDRVAHVSRREHRARAAAREADRPARRHHQRGAVLPSTHLRVEIF